MALEVRIKKSFPNFKLDVEFRTGEEVFGVLGESGCGKRVGYLFQEYALFPHMTVEENIAVGAGVVLKQKKSGIKKRKKSL